MINTTNDQYPALDRITRITRIIERGSVVSRGGRSDAISPSWTINCGLRYARPVDALGVVA
jgi:hypothetical protein